MDRTSRQLAEGKSFKYVPLLLRKWLRQRDWWNRRYVDLINIVESVLREERTWPWFFPRWREPRVSDIPKLICVSDAINGRKNDLVHTVVLSRWISILWPGGHDQYYKDSVEMIYWCIENCKGEWCHHAGIQADWYFTDGRDAALFKLTWLKPELVGNEYG